MTNGSPTAFPGGDRDRWEERLFGGAYHDGVDRTHERPKYGALNVMFHPDGASPRFGSCYLELSREALLRSTFSWGDTYSQPKHYGTLARFEPILAAWLEAITTSHAALGVADVDLATLITRLQNEMRTPHRSRPHGRALDDYIEAHVHGPIALENDVEALVIDPAFDGTPTGERLAAIATRYGIALRKHAGFVLHPNDVPSVFRGPRMIPLAKRIANDSEFDVHVIGQAAQSLVRDPGAWQDWGTPAETWQELKQLWHVLVRHGRPRLSTDSRTSGENVTEGHSEPVE
jgi:hypothetical protein